MNTFFYPETIALYGISTKPGNTPRIILENCLRWGYRGRIFGINPATEETEVSGIRVYRSAADLPVLPDLAALLIPARYVVAAVEDCGQAGIRRLAIQAGGFNEAGEEGRQRAAELLAAARRHQIRFVGPNGLTLANTANGLCLPFVPSLPVARGGFSMITQSGGLGLFLWNLLEGEQVGMAKFVSIGNKLDLDEGDFLEYLGHDPDTKVIGCYLESITDGRRLIDLAQQIDKPIVIFKANTTSAGRRAAMSHTAALGNDDDICDIAFERAGIIRIDHLRDFVTTAKAFALPPMRGPRIMAMSPAGGLAVAMADICEQQGFTFADPGEDVYRELTEIANAGIISPGNPLDMGDIYRIDKYPAIFSRVLASDQVDGAVYVSQWPRMPQGGADVFTAMFSTDIFLETTGAIRSAAKPLAMVLYGHGPALAAKKQELAIPVFDGPDEALVALKRQMTYYSRKAEGVFTPTSGEGLEPAAARSWLQHRHGDLGEEVLELLEEYGLPCPRSGVAATAAEAGQIATAIGYPVVMKVVSPDALHKSEAGGVLTGIASEAEVHRAFARIGDNLRQFRNDARFHGVRIAAMATDGHDFFIGGLRDPAFGPVLFFGLGGIHVEIFQDVQRVLCPSSEQEILMKLQRLRAWPILTGARGGAAIDPGVLVDAILRISQLLVDCPRIEELDLNPVRLLPDARLMVLDARMRLQQL
ncbi:acetate--CoA ligase family protein [Desulfobulbus alkaliphilus]|uniref:acetate--CoA ligase family protein n=1 Tax=Desulfobulbus alkaliphilus TaxID=869814 RepID=UPI0019624849|nr:acetate--CoA ligase family protein [Desulfobulbus alkaliphilus]MBM9538070.1 acetate--CoA ligase family protein [Desulfobulbus alkaliphilus]